LGIKSPWKSFDEEMNLYLKLVGTFMDKWSVSSAEIVEIVPKVPNITQDKIGKQLGIQQSAVSRRWNRANLNEILEVEKMFKKKIQTLLL
jgi:DNA-binding transcriptional regulator LsrR (DeoR family)